MLWTHGKIFDMKSVKKSKMTKEPTVSDVMGAVQDLTEAMQAGFTKVEERINDEFGQVGGRFERIERSIRTFHAGQENLAETINDTHRRVVNLEHRVEDVRETLSDITEAEEKDAEATINHEFRISHLEKIGGVKSVPPKHLAGLE